MNINLRKLRALIKETISETYLGTSSNLGGLDSDAFNKSGTYSTNRIIDPNTETEPIDEVELTQALLGIFSSIPHIPSNIDSASEPSVMENDIAEIIRAHIGGDADFPIGDFGDRAFNHAAEEASKILINEPDNIEGAASEAARALLSPDTEYDRASTRMYEEIIAFPRNLLK